ncbi:Peroxidase superfamily protein isoform 1 [Gracilaria domingensis]|nr:Peroxidase superfamily protein isoform 1 [Gracilaria domingensis]
MPPADSVDPTRDPPVQVVAAKLLQRKGFRPAGDQLNVLAAAWIQAMTDVAVARARTGRGGKLHQGAIEGALPKADDGTNLVGDSKNSWVGVSLLQEIFLREHNAIADAIAGARPELKEDDEKLFNLARLAVSAITAKIHTIDWTVELLKTDTLEVGIDTHMLISPPMPASIRYRNSNWFGLPRALGLPFSKGPPGLFSLVAQDTENHGVPYCLTEEFVSVYRLHPLLPDGLPIDSHFVPLSDLIGLPGDEKLNKEGEPEKYWDAVLRYPCGNLELFNYPKDLRQLPPTDEYGRQKPDLVDLAALDLYRDRERGIRCYNDFRRALHMKAFKSIKDLCGDNEDAYKAMVEVYGEDGIENVDLMVGMLAEKKIKGFAISETAFLIFLLMASRRLEADRFFTTDFNAKTYTDIGFAWVKSVTSMRDVLKRHFPELEKKIPDGYSAFKPRDKWPAEHM